MKREAIPDFDAQEFDSDAEEEQRLLSLRSSVDHDFDISQLNLNTDNFPKPESAVTHDNHV
jgi:hypothetical protein